MSPTTPLSLDRTSAAPLYRQIEDQLRGAIRARRLAPGSRVPSIRALARQLGVARLTVVTAYEGLAAEGYLVGRVGVGTVVASEPAPSSGSPAAPMSASGPRRLPDPRSAAPLRPLDADSFEGSVHGHATVKAGTGSAVEARIDLRPGATALDLFPQRVWERVVREAWHELTPSDGRGPADAPGAAGDPRLRAALALHLEATRATVGGPARIVVTSGAAAAFAAIAALWLEPGRVAVVEEPGRPEVRRALQSSGATVVGVPVDDRGLMPDRLPAAASVVVVSPSWQYPLGGTLPLARRGRLLAWAAAAGAVIVEDDRGDPVRPGTRRPASLQGIDPDDQVIHVAGFDPVLFPGIRTGALLVPDGLAQRFAAVLESIDPGPSPVEQRALARFIRNGHLARHEAHLQVVLAARQAVLLEALQHELGWLLSVEPVAAGLHLVAHIEDERWSTATFVDVAARAGVHVGRVTCGSRGPGAGEDERRLLFQFARHSPAELRAGVAALASAIRAGPPRWARAVGPDDRGVPAARAGRRVAQP